MIKLAPTVKIVLFSAMLFVVNAQQDTSKSEQDRMNMGPMMDSTAKCGMMMMHFMKPSAAFSTTDGGFVIIIGNKIMKYDKDAVLKKQVEIKLDTTAMRKMMQQMEQCPMVKSKKQGTDTTNHTPHRP